MTDEALDPATFCRVVAQSLLAEEPRLAAVDIDLEQEHFVIRMVRRGGGTRPWTWPVSEAPYDPDLTAPWTTDRAQYLAVLAAEENTAYIHGNE